jgi:hypothetical protein
MNNAVDFTRHDAADVRALRRRIYSRPVVSRADLEQALSFGGDKASEEYMRLLADVATDLLVNQGDPPKYVSQADADWLIESIRGTGALSTSAEFIVLTEVIRYAVRVPPSLAAFCVGEIEKAIISGRPDHPAGHVSEDDLIGLREAAFAAVQGSSLHVTRDSAEALFRIARATKDAANDPGFDEFFAKAVGNYLMGIAFHWTPSADAEREKENWENQKSAGLGGLLGAMFGGPRVPRLDIRSPDEIDEERLRAENAADAQEMAMASEIDPQETNWLIAQLSRPGALTGAERALLQFLKREAPTLPAKLQERISEVAA